MDIKGTFDSAQVQKAIAEAPARMRLALDRYLRTAADDVTNEARIKASEHNDYGALRESILSENTSENDLLRYTVAPHVKYAGDVEYGTHPGYFPNLAALLDWLNTTRQRGFRLARAGSKPRESQARDLRNRAGALGRYIQQHGTQAHPFMAPTKEKMESRVVQAVRDGLARDAQWFKA